VLLDVSIEKDSKNAALEIEIERKNFTKAAQLAASLNLNNGEIENLRHQALCRMAAHNRNAHGVKILAQEYGYSKQEVKQILERYANQMREKGNIKPLGVCYDSSSSKYLTFEDWIIHCIEKWHKLKVPLM